MRSSRFASRLGGLVKGDAPAAPFVMAESEPLLSHGKQAPIPWMLAPVAYVTWPRLADTAVGHEAPCLSGVFHGRRAPP